MGDCSIPHIWYYSQVTIPHGFRGRSMFPVWKNERKPHTIRAVCSAEWAWAIERWFTLAGNYTQNPDCECNGMIRLLG